MALPISQIISVLNLAYQHREKAVAIHEKIKQWSGDSDDFPVEAVDDSAPIETRVTLLEQSANHKDALDEEQSSLIIDLSKDISNLASLSSSINRKLNLISIIAIVALCFALVALVISLN